MSLYDRYEPRLDRLSRKADPLPAIVGRIGAANGWWPGDGAWARRFARFDPGASEYASFVYETTEGPQRLARVRIQEQVPEGVLANAADPVLGHVLVSPITHDRALRGLSAVLDGHGDAIRVMRYRPEKRCTLKVDEANSPLRFVKVFADDQGTEVHENSCRLWKAACTGSLDFSVAEPDRWDPATRSLWQGPVNGVSVAPLLFAEDGPGLAHRMGRALASIVRSAIEPTDVFDFAKQMARTTRYADDLCRRLPELDDEIRHLVRCLSDLDSQPRRRSLRPIHGSPHVHQWLMDGQKLGLVDFDRMSLGDPELDAATFIAEMDYEDPVCVPVEAINARFLEGYEEVAGPLDHRLLLSYRLQKHVAKALKASRAVRCDAPKRARRNLSRVKRQLREAGYL